MTVKNFLIFAILVYRDPFDGHKNFDFRDPIFRDPMVRDPIDGSQNIGRLSYFIAFLTILLYLHHFLFISDPTFRAREARLLNRLQGIDPEEVIPIYQTRLKI